MDASFTQSWSNSKGGRWSNSRSHYSAKAQPKSNGVIYLASGRMSYAYKHPDGWATQTRFSFCPLREKGHFRGGVLHSCREHESLCFSLSLGWQWVDNLFQIKVYTGRAIFHQSITARKSISRGAKMCLLSRWRGRDGLSGWSRVEGAAFCSVQYSWNWRAQEPGWILHS